MTMLRDCSTWGRCPQTPGIYRLEARMSNGGGWRRPRPFRLLSRRSGCVPAVPYPPLRFFQSGLHQLRRATIFQRTATTPLTCCLTPGVQFILRVLDWLAAGLPETALWDPANASNAVSETMDEREKWAVANAAWMSLKAEDWGDVV